MVGSKYRDIGWSCRLLLSPRCRKSCGTFRHRPTVAPPVPDREAHPLLGQSVFAVFRERRVASANPVYAVIGKRGKMVLLLWVEHHAHTTTSGLRDFERSIVYSLCLSSFFSCKYQRRLCGRREQIGASREHFCSQRANVTIEATKQAIEVSRYLPNLC